MGLVFTGHLCRQAHAQNYVNQPGMANGDHAAGWRRVVDAVHAENTPIFQQFIHAGALIQHNRYQQTGIAPSGRSARANDATLFRRGPFLNPGKSPKMK